MLPQKFKRAVLVAALLFNLQWMSFAKESEVDISQGNDHDHNDDLDAETHSTTMTSASTLTAPPPLPTPDSTQATSTPDQMPANQSAVRYAPHKLMTDPTKRQLAWDASNSRFQNSAGLPQPISDEMMTPPLQFKPETKEELFARIDVDSDGTVDINDYMRRDRFYVESVKSEFDQIDTDKDSKITKAEFDDYIEMLENQRKLSLLRASNFTLKRHDFNNDNSLSEEELATYINGSLHRSTANLPQVFKEFDADGNGMLSLEEFSELDFQFPWEKFPLNGNAFGASVFAQAGPAAPFFAGAESTGPVPPVAGNFQAPPRPLRLF